MCRGRKTILTLFIYCLLIVGVGEFKCRRALSLVQVIYSKHTFRHFILDRFYLFRTGNMRLPLRRYSWQYFQALGGRAIGENLHRRLPSQVSRRQGHLRAEKIHMRIVTLYSFSWPHLGAYNWNARILHEEEQKHGMCITGSYFGQFQIWIEFQVEQKWID